MFDEVILQHLSDIYEIWLDKEEIAEPYVYLPANELLYERAQELTQKQRHWLSAYIEIWRKSEN